MNRSLISRLEQAERAAPEAEQRVFQVIDDEAECERLRAAFPDALIIHRTIIRPALEEKSK